MPDNFLRRWVAANVEPVPAQDRHDRVAIWAAFCVTDAMLNGYSPDDIAKAAGGDILTYLRQAADDVARG